MINSRASVSTGYPTPSIGHHAEATRQLEVGRTMSSSILITGSAGFLGSAIVQHLSSQGLPVLAQTRRPAVFPVGTQPWLLDDLCRLPPDTPGRLRGVATVVHCAARVHMLQEQSIDPLAEFRRVNVDATLALARQAAAAGVRRFVFISSIGVNGNQNRDMPFRHDDKPQPDTPYTLSKWDAEQSLAALGQETGMEMLFVRPPMVYGRNAPGNFALLVKLVRKGWPLPLGSLHAPRSFVALDNLVELLATLATQPQAEPGVYLAGDGPQTSTTDFITDIARALGQTPHLWKVPLPLLMGLTTLVGRTDQLRKLAVPLAVDIAATTERCGWHPRHTQAQALYRALAPTAPENRS